MSASSTSSRCSSRSSRSSVLVGASSQLRRGLGCRRRRRRRLEGRRLHLNPEGQQTDQGHDPARDEERRGVAEALERGRGDQGGHHVSGSSQPLAARLAKLVGRVVCRRRHQAAPQSDAARRLRHEFTDGWNEASGRAANYVTDANGVLVDQSGGRQLRLQ